MRRFSAPQAIFLVLCVQIYYFLNEICIKMKKISDPFKNYLKFSPVVKIFTLVHKNLMHQSKNFTHQSKKPHCTGVFQSTGCTLISALITKDNFRINFSIFKNVTPSKLHKSTLWLANVYSGSTVGCELQVHNFKSICGLEVF